MGGVAVRKKIVLLCVLLWTMSVSRLCLATSCQKCHPPEKVAPESQQWHSPFLKGRCEICHGTGASVSQSLTLDPKAVKWFLQRDFRGGKAYIVLSPRVKQYDLVFQSENPSLQEILSTEEAKALPPAPEPEIERIWFCGLEEGPWVEAEICVQTNVPTQVHISCGKLEGYTEEDYYTDQVVPLTRVDKGKTYTCTVEARDIQGAPAAPKKFIFKAVERGAEPLRPRAKEVQVGLYKSPLEEILLKIVSDGELSWRLGGIPRTVVNNPKKAEPKDHPKMNPLRWSGTEACYRCHKKNMLGVSHPVDVPLRASMANEQGLPLQGGVMTCATCHNPHGSAYPYFLRKYGEALCLSCHNEIYK